MLHSGAQLSDRRGLIRQHVWAKPMCTEAVWNAPNETNYFVFVSWIDRHCRWKCPFFSLLHGENTCAGQRIVQKNSDNKTNRFFLYIKKYLYDQQLLTYCQLKWLLVCSLSFQTEDVCDVLLAGNIRDCKVCCHKAGSVLARKEAAEVWVRGTIDPHT